MSSLRGRRNPGAAQQLGRSCTSIKLSLGSLSLVLPAAAVSKPCGELWSLRSCCTHRYSCGMEGLRQDPLCDVCLLSHGGEAPNAPCASWRHLSPQQWKAGPQTSATKPNQLLGQHHQAGKEGVCGEVLLSSGLCCSGDSSCL